MRALELACKMKRKEEEKYDNFHGKRRSSVIREMTYEENVAKEEENEK